MIVCAAVIGQENNPLYLDSFLTPSSPEHALKFSYIVHCALDAVDAKVNAPKRTPGEVADAFLGMLYPTEEYRVYGFVSNTKVKLILVLDSNAVFKDDDLRPVFRRFHAVYMDAVSNPFYNVGAPIMSAKFGASVKTIVDSGIGA